MQVVLIGQGNVATHLGEAIRAAGHELVAVGGRTRRCPIPAKSDVYVIAVSDRAIPDVAAELTDVDGLVVHTAGSIPMSALPLKRRGVLYPMQTFSKSRPVDFGRVPLFIESDTDMPLLETFARSLSQHVTVMDSDRRRYLHLAAVFCCNFTNHMFSVTEQLLGSQGIPLEVMFPLIEETVDKIHQLSPREAQTGPAVRWDEGVMQAQLSLIDNPLWQQVYDTISKSIHEERRTFG